MQKSNFEDWVGDNDEGYSYRDNRPRGNKKKRKNKNKPQEPTWDWDDIYDPTLPNNYVDYKGSEEQHREIRDWKARLYYHQLKANKNGDRYSDEEPSQRDQGPTNSMMTCEYVGGLADMPLVMFAPPSNLNFAPPTFDDAAPARPQVADKDDDVYPPTGDVQSLPRTHQQPSFAPPSFSKDSTGEDAYMRRMQMSGVESQATPPPAPAAPASQPAQSDIEAKRAAAQAKIAAFKAKLQKPGPKPDVAPAVPPPPPPPAAEVASPEQRGLLQPQVFSAAGLSPPTGQPGSMISRAPVRYELPPPPPELPAEDDVEMTDADADEANAAQDQPRTNRPGQKGFAERLLKKYGWEKGQGLGAQGEGITTAIVAKADKRKKLPDAKGGGWAAPANMGKIVGGKKRKIDTSSEATGTDDPRFGKMSEVIKLESMLDGLDVQREIEDNNLMQEVGDEMGSKYGNVERVFVWREEIGGKNEVFVKFTSQLSALRAVNAMMGTSFAGNEVTAMFWDVEKFEKGEYA
jgi:splicing factor 45